MKELSEKYVFLWINITAVVTQIFLCFYFFSKICEIKDNLISFLIILRLSKSLMYNVLIVAVNIISSNYFSDRT